MISCWGGGRGKISKMTLVILVRVEMVLYLKKFKRL